NSPWHTIRTEVSIARPRRAFSARRQRSRRPVCRSAGNVAESNFGRNEGIAAQVRANEWRESQSCDGTGIRRSFYEKARQDIHYQRCRGRVRGSSADIAPL